VPVWEEADDDLKTPPPTILEASSLDECWPDSDALHAIKFRVLDPISSGPNSEYEILSHCNDKVLQIAEWITEAMTFASQKNWCQTPPPILSRVYQEISNGMLGYNQAAKVTLVPFPFPFTQMVSLLLVSFVVISPIVIAQWTGGPFLSAAFSFFVTLGYWGLNEICGELENPFGDDANDLPLVEIHQEFIEALSESISLRPPVHFLDLVGITVETNDRLYTFVDKDEKMGGKPPAAPVPHGSPAVATVATQTIGASPTSREIQAAKLRCYTQAEDPFCTSAKRVSQTESHGSTVTGFTLPGMEEVGLADLLRAPDRAA